VVTGEGALLNMGGQLVQPHAQRPFQPTVADKHLKVSGAVQRTSHWDHHATSQSPFVIEIDKTVGICEAIGCASPVRDVFMPIGGLLTPAQIAQLGEIFT